MKCGFSAGIAMCASHPMYMYKVQHVDVASVRQATHWNRLTECVRITAGKLTAVMATGVAALVS